MTGPLCTGLVSVMKSFFVISLGWPPINSFYVNSWQWEHFITLHFKLVQSSAIGHILWFYFTPLFLDLHSFGHRILKKILFFFQFFKKKVDVKPREGRARPHASALLSVWQRLRTLGTFLHDDAHISISQKFRDIMLVPFTEGNGPFQLICLKVHFLKCIDFFLLSYPIVGKMITSPQRNDY